MKIIAVGMNYALHNRALGHEESPADPVIFMKPDSALLRDGKPFFLPDFAREFHPEAELVVRISRLGKCIAPRFAHRYYDAVTVGIDFTARDLQRRFRQSGLPWELSKCFDGAAVTGTFLPLDQAGGDVQRLDFRLDVDGVTMQQGHTADMLHSVDEIVAYVSRFMTLKMGDLIYTGTPAATEPVRVGQHLQGYLGPQLVLDFHVR